MQLKVNPEYLALVPRPVKEQYDALKLSVMIDGLMSNLEALEDGTVIDGHTRLQICSELNQTIPDDKITVKHFDSELDTKLYILDVNLKRRHLNDFQRVSLECLRLEIYREKARLQHERDDGTGQFKPRVPNGKDGNFQVNEIIAQQSGVSPRTVARVIKIRKNADAHTIKELENGKRTIGSAYNIVTEKERQETKNDSLAEIKKKMPDDISLMLGDFRTAGVADDSVQLVLTDPPYMGEYLSLWEDLAVFAKRVLVPGGYLVTYCGHFYLPTVLEMMKKHLEYFWIIALTQQQHVLVHSRHVFCDWKPIIVFYKPPLSLPDYFGDVINGAGLEKNHHEWQQAEAELDHIIRTFCPPNGVILDPCAGSGTTLAAAKRLKRKSIGIEQNSDTFKTMQQRLSNLDV